MKQLSPFVILLSFALAMGSCSSRSDGETIIANLKAFFLGEDIEVEDDQSYYSFEQSDSMRTAVSDSLAALDTAYDGVPMKGSVEQVKTYLDKALAYLRDCKNESDCADKRRYAKWADDQIIKARNELTILRVQDTLPESVKRWAALERTLASYADIIQACNMESEVVHFDQLIKQGTDSVKAARRGLD